MNNNILPGINSNSDSSLIAKIDNRKTIKRRVKILNILKVD